MNILYDGFVYGAQTAGGISKYFTNIISILPDEIFPELVTYQTQCLDFPRHKNLRVIKAPSFRPEKLCAFFGERYFRLAVNFDSIDVVHPTYYNNISNWRRTHPQAPVVLTIWDMVHEIFAASSQLDSNLTRIKQEAIESADALICISENTKKDLTEFYDVAEKPIHVTHLSTDLNLEMSYGNNFVPESPYFVYVGGRAGYKNFDFLLKAFSRVVRRYSELKLCVIGAPLTTDESRLIGALKLQSHIVSIKYPSNQHLAKLYRCSQALIYPSKYEGFGIPPLEAMSCGTVAISSSSSSLPEVVGDDGLLFNPYSIDSLVEKIVYLLENSSARERLIERGLARAKKFSWIETARQTVNVYKSVQ